MNFKDQNNTEPSGEFAAAIRDFRAAVTHVAGRETARPIAVDWLAPARKRRRHQHRVVLAWACAAALCFATLPFATMPFSIHLSPAAATHAGTQPTPSAPLLQSSEPDSTLLEQVDAEVSESVPSSLAPLAELENLNTANTSGDSSLDGTVPAQPESTNADH